MSDQQPNIIPPHPQAAEHPHHPDPMADPAVMKRLAEMGALMVCAPVALKITGPDGRPLEVKASMMDIMIQIAQGAPLASSIHPVRRQEEGRDVIQNTSVLQLLAEIADYMNDLCCMGQELLEAQGIGGDDDEEDLDDKPPRRGRKSGGR